MRSSALEIVGRGIDALVARIQRAHRPPIWVEILNAGTTAAFGWGLVMLPAISVSACTRDVLSQIMAASPCGWMMLALGIGGLVSILLDGAILRFAFAVAFLFIWATYSRIRLGCPPIPADALYVFRAVGCAITVYYTGARCLGGGR